MTLVHRESHFNETIFLKSKPDYVMNYESVLRLVQLSIPGEVSTIGENLFLRPGNSWILYRGIPQANTPLIACIAFARCRRRLSDEAAPVNVFIKSRLSTQALKV